MLSMVRSHVAKLKYYDKITGMSEIIRRSFVNNSFDGALTMMGVLLGSYITGIDSYAQVLKLGFATAIAIGISGFTGAMFAEQAERSRQIKDMERTLHRDLDNTEFKKAHDSASMLTALVDGFSPIITSVLILTPFFITLTNIETSYQISMIIALMVFFTIGMFLGKIGKDSVLLTGLKLVAAGLFCMLLIFLLGTV